MNVKPLIVIPALLVFSLPAAAQKPIVYPAKGQSAQQQKKDDTECLAWAKQNTGIDPAVASAPPPQDAGTGAAAGAAVGTMAGGRKARQNQQAANQQAQQQQQQTMATYYRAYGACMEGRGYTIK